MDRKQLIATLVLHGFEPAEASIGTGKFRDTRMWRTGLREAGESRLFVFYSAKHECIRTNQKSWVASALARHGAVSPPSDCRRLSIFWRSKMADEFTTEQMIAHLTLHGWRPASLMQSRETVGEGTGVLCENHRFCYVPPGFWVIMLTSDSPTAARREPREWCNIPTTDLRAIFYYILEEQNEKRI